MAENISAEGSEFPPLTPEEVKEHKRLDKILDGLPHITPKPKDKPKSTKQKIKIYDTVRKFLDEYLDTYVIIGFDTAGDEFVMRHNRNPMEMRALNDILNEYFDNGNEMSDEDGDNDD
jgi:hypothetical protein